MGKPKEDCKPMLPQRGGWSAWVEPIMKGYRMQCCDCGLVHEMQFKVVEQIGKAAADGSWPARPIKNGRVSLRARRER